MRTQRAVIQLRQQLSFLNAIANAHIDADDTAITFRGDVGLLFRHQRTRGR